MTGLDEQDSQIGSLAPKFGLTNQHGQDVASFSGDGRSTMVFFYPYAFTGVCTREVRGLAERAEAFEQANCRVLAISTDTVFSLRIFDGNENLGLELLSDHWPHGRVAQLFGCFDERLGCAKRASFLMGGDNMISWQALGDLPHERDLDAHLEAAQALRP